MTWQPQRPDEGARQRLVSGLGVVESGCSQDFVTRIIRREDQSSLDSGRQVTAESFARAITCELLPAHALAETKQRAKHGTYSRRPGYFTPDDQGLTMSALVRRYFEPHTFNVAGGALDYADDAVKALYDVRKGYLNLASLRTAHDSFLGKTGLGWPVFGSNRALLPVIWEGAAEIIRHGYPRESVHLYPAVVGFRGQPRGSGQFCKFRAIYQCSRVMGLLEKMVQIPCLAALRHQEVFASLAGRTAVNNAITRIFRRSQRPITSIDFSNFDASVPLGLIRRVFGLMAGWFAPVWHPHINYLKEVFCGCGIIVPHKERPYDILMGELRLGGIPSGSVLTNLIGSLVCLWCLKYAAARNRGEAIDFQICGDDAVCRFIRTDKEAIAKTLLTDLGMILSAEKSLVSTVEVHYLQNVFHRAWFDDNGVNIGVRPLMRVLNGMMSYEDVNRRWDTTPEDKGKYDSFRWLQQLENASDHPAFKQACQWVLERDGKMESVLGGILRKDDALLARAKLALSGKHEWGKVAIDGLACSRVFHTMLQLSVKGHSTS